MQSRWLLFVLVGIGCFPGLSSAAEPVVIDGGLHHLRIDGPREWTAFPEQPEAAGLDLRFSARPKERESTLTLRQQNVKQQWEVRLNDRPLGRLVINENDMFTDFAVPPGTLVEGENRLTVQQVGRDTPDDVRVGEISLWAQTARERRRDGEAVLRIVEGEGGQPTPCRITITDQRGVLIPVGAKSDENLAVRNGVVYCGSGEARFGLAAGTYRICAGRGFEYSLDSCECTIAPGETIERTLTITREVPTKGWVACDTHVHTLTYSGHGDASIEERMITLAGEGIELPIATDHNKHIDYDDVSRRLGLRQHFTPVIGNEVTTKHGHFNIFPVDGEQTPTPDHTLTEWGPLFDEIFNTPDVHVAILNHGRDLHSGFRPLGARHYISLTGENLDGWVLQANAMELVNSAAVQSDPMQLVRDWFGLLNAGRRITPVGSSDSHDVARHFVGQGRTYIRCDDGNPGEIDVEDAVEAFLAGKVIVGYGLLVELDVNEQAGPGELLTLPNDAEEGVTVVARVLGPHWTRADSVELYVNGRRQFREELSPPAGDHATGEKAVVRWRLRRDQLPHDSWIVAVAHGPGITEPYWPTARPYQPDSPEWTPATLSVTGPVWLDVDGDSHFNSTRQLAEQAIQQSAGDLGRCIEHLSGYDEAVAAQAAALLRVSGTSSDGDDLTRLLETAAPTVRAGFRTYAAQWRESQIARIENRE